jgi:two-component system chemotaxis response regulator CheY
MFPDSTRILVVDDMPSLRELLKAHLRRIGFKNIVEAKDGQEAYQLLISSKSVGTSFDLVVCDWNMPNMTGLELLKVVRAVDIWKKLPFLLLTTESEKGKVMEAISSGVNNYMVKPVEEQVLREKLASVWKKMQEN